MYGDNGRHTPPMTPIPDGWPVPLDIDTMGCAVSAVSERLVAAVAELDKVEVAISAVRGSFEFGPRLFPSIPTPLLAARALIGEAHDFLRPLDDVPRETAQWMQDAYGVTIT